MVGSICMSKNIIIGIMGHDIFDFAIKDIAKLVYGIHFYILIVTKSVKLRTVHMIFGI